MKILKTIGILLVANFVLLSFSDLNKYDVFIVLGFFLVGTLGLVVVDRKYPSKNEASVESQ